jgi:kinesin family member 2/24
MFVLFPAYCKRGEELFTQLADLALACKELMGEFRSKLTKEEILSANMKHPGKR